MARAELEKSWVTPQDADEVRAEALRVLQRWHRMNLWSDTPGEIVATAGSQLLTRLLGGWFVPARWLPMRVTITFRRAADGMRVRAYFEEKMGWGFLDPILQQKYERYFGEVMFELQGVCGERFE